MAKQGILHDYDLWANNEPSSENQTCVICGTSPMTFQWSDYSGEAMCTICGCPYQLKWGSKEKEVGAKYPYLNMNHDFIPIAKEYWETTHQFVCYGMMMGPRPGYRELIEWIKQNHPEWLEKEEK